jgi:hypothetical protein
MVICEQTLTITHINLHLHLAVFISCSCSAILNDKVPVAVPHCSVYLPFILQSKAISMSTDNETMDDYETSTPEPYHGPIIFREMSVDHIRNNQDFYNTNNHTFDDLPEDLQAHEKVPLAREDYSLQVARTSYSIWQPILAPLQQKPQSGQYARIPLPPRLCKLLKEACEIGMQTRRVSELFREDLEEALFPLLEPYFKDKPQYFVRLDEASPKDGIGRMGPFADMQAVLTALVTSQRAYKAFVHAGPSGEALHLVPWRTDIDTSNEFRVFVPADGKVRAISQYTERLVGWADNEFARLKDLVPHILVALEKFRCHALEAGVALPPEGYVLDVHAAQKNDNWVVEPVELNGFGAQMSSGSGLFNWLTDWQTMYGLTEELEVRVVGL